MRRDDDACCDSFGFGGGADSDCVAAVGVVLAVAVVGLSVERGGPKLKRRPHASQKVAFSLGTTPHAQAANPVAAAASRMRCIKGKTALWCVALPSSSNVTYIQATPESPHSRS